MLRIGRKEPCLRNILPVERMLDKQKNVYECRNFPLLYPVFEGILNTQLHTHKSVVHFVITRQRTSTHGIQRYPYYRRFILILRMLHKIIRLQRHFTRHHIIISYRQSCLFSPPLDYKLFFTTKQDLVRKKLLVSSISCVIASSDSHTFRKN